MHTDHDNTADVLSRRLHLLVDDVVEQPDALERILADTVRSTAGPISRTASRTGFRILAAAAAAAVLAGGTYLVLPHDNANGSGQATASPGQRVTLTASEVLYRVAQVADITVSTPPREDQFEYIKSVVSHGGRTETVEDWLPQSPTAEGVVHTNGKFAFVIAPWSAGLTPTAKAQFSDPNYAFLAALPTDPTRVLHAINANGKHQPAGGTLTETSFSNVVGLVGDQILPPKLAAAIYRALAALPGISIDQNAVDAAGRHGVGVGATGFEGEELELIFDPTNFTLLGTRTAPPAHNPGGQHGNVTFAGPSQDAIIEQAIVDAAGQVPAK
jgi:hypothetical protein